MEQVEREKKLGFLWKAAHHYAATCPALSAHMMQQFSSVGGIGLPDKARECFCPSCGSLFRPGASRWRCATRQDLRAARQLAQRRGRDVEWLPRWKSYGQGRGGEESNGSGRRRSFIQVHCQLCRKSYVTATKKPAQLTAHSRPTTPLSTRPKLGLLSADPPLPGTPLWYHKTPSRESPASLKSKAKSSRRRSSSLKSLLMERSRVQLEQTQRLSASPRLGDFLY